MPAWRITIGAALLVATAGAALAQPQAHGNAAAAPPAISSASPAAQDPGVNPSAAGTQWGGRSGRVAESVKGGREHSGSKNLTANDHPFAALKYNRQIRKRQQTQQILQGATGASGQTLPSGGTGR